MQTAKQVQARLRNRKVYAVRGVWSQIVALKLPEADQKVIEGILDKRLTALRAKTIGEKRQADLDQLDN